MRGREGAKPYCLTKKRQKVTISQKSENILIWPARGLLPSPADAYDKTPYLMIKVTGGPVLFGQIHSNSNLGY